MKSAISSYLPEFMALRHDLHQHPELGFEETRTSGVVARELEKAGVEVHTGWAGTGIIGVLKRGRAPETIALRADMDALPVQERSDLVYRSTNQGVMAMRRMAP